MLAKLTPPTPEAQIAETAELLPKFSAAGITAVFEAGIATMPAETGYDGYQQLEKENKLPVRVVGTYYWNNPEEKDPVEPVLKLRDKYKSELVQVKTLKIMMDGGEAQHTAVLLKPYYDRPGFNARISARSQACRGRCPQGTAERGGHPLSLLRGCRHSHLPGHRGQSREAISQ